MHMAPNIHALVMEISMTVIYSINVFLHLEFILKTTLGE